MPNRTEKSDGRSESDRRGHKQTDGQSVTLVSEPQPDSSLEVLTEVYDPHDGRKTRFVARSANG